MFRGLACLAVATVLGMHGAQYARANPTVDQMYVQDLWRTYFPSAEPALFLIQHPTYYFLGDGSSWESGAGTGQQYTTRVSEQTIHGDVITYVLDRPVGSLIFKRTDYNAGHHQAQGELGATAPLTLTAVLGSSVATLASCAAIVSNEPTALGEAQFNYFSAAVGDRAPFQLTYTLRGNATWGPDTFDTQFDYDIAGMVDFAAAVPEPATALDVALGALLAFRRRTWRT